MRRPRLAISALICVLPLALAACGESTATTDARTQLPLVRTVAVQDASGSSRSFTGTVAARVQSDLGFRVPGKVLQRLVDTGQTVKRGQVLMRIDPVDLKLAAEAQLDAVAAAKQLNAFITETPDKALAMADASDARLKSGSTATLEGVPLAIKDLFCTKDVRTTASSSHGERRALSRACDRSSSLALGSLVISASSKASPRAVRLCSGTSTKRHGRIWS